MEIEEFEAIHKHRESRRQTIDGLVRTSRDVEMIGERLPTVTKHTVTMVNNRPVYTKTVQENVEPQLGIST